MGIRKISLFGKEGLGEILEEYDGDHGFINRNGLNCFSCEHLTPAALRGYSRKEHMKLIRRSGPTK